MSQFHNIFCRDGHTFTRAQIAEVARESYYGDGDLSFSPAPDQDPAWREFQVRLPTTARPIIFLHDTDPAAIAELVGEKTSEPPVQLRDTTIARVRATRQIYGVELAPDLLDDDAWEMLDIVQAFIARERDGLLFTPEGVYDEALQPTN